MVVNRVHPDEYCIGDQVDQLFAEAAIPGVRLVTREIHRRGGEQRGLVPGSNTMLRTANPAGDLDEQFLWEITEASRHASAVLDIHAHRRRGEASYPFYGELARHNPLVRGIASLLCSNEVLIHPASLYLAGNLPHYVGWDLAPDTDVKALRPTLEKLGSGWSPPTRPMQEFVYVGGVPVTDLDKYGFAKVYRQFEPLPAKAVAKARLPEGSCASAWNAALYTTCEVVAPVPKEAPMESPFTST